MANHSTQGEQKKSISAPQKALIALVVGALAVSVMYYFFRDVSANLTEPALSQDSFQGPAELSTAVQISCQDSAKKIFEESNCAEKEVEFLKNAANCLNVYYSLDIENDSPGTEGNFGDISLQIARCYSALDKSNGKAIDFLKKVNAQFDWDIYMGPISCDSKSTLSAQIESYSKARVLKCLKASDLPDLVAELKNRNFKILETLLATDEIGHQGIIEADVSCPEPFVNIEKNLTRLLATAFEITEPKLEPGAPDDVFIELTRNNIRLLNLQFKVKTDGCLHFQSLLAPPVESE